MSPSLHSRGNTDAGGRPYRNVCSLTATQGDAASEKIESPEHVTQASVNGSRNECDRIGDYPCIDSLESVGTWVQNDTAPGPPYERMLSELANVTSRDPPPASRRKGMFESCKSSLDPNAPFALYKPRSNSSAGPGYPATFAQTRNGAPGQS